MLSKKRASHSSVPKGTLWHLCPRGNFRLWIHLSQVSNSWLHSGQRCWLPKLWWKVTFQTDIPLSIIFYKLASFLPFLTSQLSLLSVPLWGTELTSWTVSRAGVPTIKICILDTQKFKVLMPFHKSFCGTGSKWLLKTLTNIFSCLWLIYFSLWRCSVASRHGCMKKFKCFLITIGPDIFFWYHKVQI